MHFYPTASAANVPAPSAPQRALTFLGTCLAVPRQEVYFVPTAAASQAHWFFPCSLTFILVSTVLAEMLDFTNPRGEGRSIFFPLYLDLEIAASTPKHPDQNGIANRTQTTENM